MWGGGGWAAPISRQHSVIALCILSLNIMQYNEAQSRKTNQCRKYIIVKQNKNLDPEIGQGSQCSHVGLQHSGMT